MIRFENASPEGDLSVFLDDITVTLSPSAPQCRASSLYFEAYALPGVCSGLSEWTPTPPAAVITGIEAADLAYDASPTADGITLDADLADWGCIPFLAQTPFRTGNADRVNAPWVEFEENGGIHNGIGDQASAFAITWEAAAMYLGVKVFDDTHQNPGSGWDGDSVQIAFTNAARTNAASEILLYSYGLSDSGDQVLHHEVHPCPGDQDCTEAAMERFETLGLTIYEMKFPAQSLGVDAFVDGYQLGVGICVNDGDTDGTGAGQKGWSGWGPYAIVHGKNSPSCGLVTLVATAAAPHTESVFVDGLGRPQPLEMLSGTSGVFDDVWNGLLPTLSIREMRGEIWYPTDDDFIRNIPDFDVQDEYRMRWRGNIDVPTTGEYGFRLRSDDGSMLYIDEHLIVDNDGLHAMQDASGWSHLAAGMHDITIVYFENNGHAGLQVSWTAVPGGDFVRLSSDVLSHTINCPCGDSLHLEIYPGGDELLGGLAGSRNKFGSLWNGMQPTASMTQAAGELLYADVAAFQAQIPEMLLHPDGFMMRWRGLISIPIEGQYAFQTRSDDGSMLYIDQQLVVDNDGAHSYQARTGMAVLSEGYHEITVLFYDVGGAAQMEVLWTPMPGSALAPMASDVLSNGVGCPADATAAVANKISGISPDARWIWAGEFSDHSIFCRMAVPLSSNARGEVQVGEEGYGSFSGEWRTIDLQGSYVNPVVMVGSLSNLDPQLATVRIRNLRHDSGGCTGWCFDVRLQEPGRGCSADEHGTDFASWTVLETGAHLTDEGAVFEVGRETIAPPGFSGVRFQGGFSSAEIVVLVHVQTYADPEYVTARLQSHTSRGFVVALEGVGSATLNPHQTAEEVGWVAFQSGVGNIGGRRYAAFLSAEVVADASTEIDFGTLFGTIPNVFATMSTYAGADAGLVRRDGAVSASATHVFIQEDHCNDDETDHAFEAVGVLAVEPSGIMTANAAMVVHSDLGSVHDVAAEDLLTKHLQNSPTTVELGAQHITILFRDVPIPQAAPVRNSHVRFQSRGDAAETVSALRLSGVMNGACTGLNFSHDGCSDTVFDAAAAVLDGPVVETGAASVLHRASGLGFVRFTNPSDDTLTFTVDNCQETGDYTLDFYYALNTGTRPLGLTVNGVVFDSHLVFESTGSWTSWGGKRVAVRLNAGSNTVALSTAGRFGPHLDSMRVTKVDQEHSPFGAVLTTASVEWHLSEWVQQAEYWTPDLSEIVEELVSAPNWVAGSDICIIFSPLRPTGARSASTHGLSPDQAPYFTAVLDPCQDLHCGLHGACDSGSCVCMGGYFGALCERPPGPSELCDPIQQRFLPRTVAACAGADDHECTADCAAATLRLSSKGVWAWGRFASMCNLEGAIHDSAVAPSGCSVLTQNASSEDSLQYPGCDWQASRCVAQLDATIVSPTASDFGPASAGIGLSACFGAFDRDGCQMMDWCSWRVREGRCGPRIHSLISVAPASFLQLDPLYDATLDPQAHILHLAEECGQHSERVCTSTSTPSCSWAHAHRQCIIASAAATALLQPPSCSDLWSHAADCRGRSSFACAGGCAWSGAGQVCLLSVRNDPVPAEQCGLESECDDDNWGLLAAAEISCSDVLGLGDCSTDLSEYFNAWPAGVTVSSICQASCGLCDAQAHLCADEPQCAEMASAWTALSNADHCTEVSTMDDQQRDHILPQSLGSSKSITFTVQASNDARIGVFGAQPDEKLYEVVLGSSSNTESSILRFGPRPAYRAPSELAPDAADCTEASVGSNNRAGITSKTVEIEAGYLCPARVSIANWLGEDSYPDTYSVVQSGRTITVTRTDTADIGWGMELRFSCCQSMSTGTFALETTALPTGLLGYWPLDGDGTDLSENALNAEPFNGRWVSGLHGRAFEFDGNDLLVVANARAQPLNEAERIFMVSWVYPAGLAEGDDGGANIIMNKENVFEYGLSSAGVMQSAFSPCWGWYGQEATLPDAEWTHTAAGVDGTSQIHYVNGERVESGRCRGALTPSTWDFKIGARSQRSTPHRSTYYFHGALDDAMLFSDLSDSDVRSLYLGLGGSSVTAGEAAETEQVVQSIETETTPNVLSAYEARSFWIDAVQGLVRVGRGSSVGQDVIMQWQDPDLHQAVRVGFLSGSAGQRRHGLDGAEWHVCFPRDHDRHRCTGAMARMCPMTCDLCRDGAAGYDNTTSIDASFASLTSGAATGQPAYGIAAVVAGWKLCSTRMQYEACSSPCVWSTGGSGGSGGLNGRCGLQQSNAIELFLGPALDTPIGGQMAGWFRRGSSCRTHGDKASCQASGKMLGMEAPAAQVGTGGTSGLGSLFGSKVSFAAATLSALAIVWVVVSMVAVRTGTKRKMGSNGSPRAGAAPTGADGPWPDIQGDNPMYMDVSHHPVDPNGGGAGGGGGTDGDYTTGSSTDEDALEPWPGASTGREMASAGGIWDWDEFYLDDVEAAFNLPNLHEPSALGVSATTTHRGARAGLQQPPAGGESPYDSGSASSSSGGLSPDRDYSSDTFVDSDYDSSEVGSGSPDHIDGYEGKISPECMPVPPGRQALVSVQSTVGPMGMMLSTHGGGAAAGWVRPRSSAVTVRAVPPLEAVGLHEQPQTVTRVATVRGRFPADRPFTGGIGGQPSDVAAKQAAPDVSAPSLAELAELTMCAPCAPAVDIRHMNVPVPAAPTGGGGGRRVAKKRKLTLKTKQEVTGALYLLCCSPELDVLERLSQEELQARFGVADKSGCNQPLVGALLRYGTDSKRTKLLLATALNDLFRALAWDFAQPPDAAVKWGTIQRDIRWRYQKREGNDSIYVFDDPPADVERYAREVAARVPINLPSVVRDSLARVAAQLQGSSGGGGDGGRVGGGGVGAGVGGGGGGGNECRPTAFKGEGGGGGSEAGGRQLYYCHVEGCGYATPERRYIMGHMRVHSGVKQFVCPAPGCGYASYSSQHLTRESITALCTPLCLALSPFHCPSN